jgi:hypothetical protein
LSSLGNAICVHQLTTSPGQGFIFKGFVSKGLASSPNTVLNISQSISSRFFLVSLFDQLCHRFFRSGFQNHSHQSVQNSGPDFSFPETGGSDVGRRIQFQGFYALTLIEI